MRLIDLHCNWSLQYACETSQYDAAIYQDVPARLPQVEGYLSSVSAAVFFCGRRPEDWARQSSPWQTLGEMIARYEAEFPGRLLRSSEDVARWQDEPDALCWGVLGLEGLDFLVRSPADLERLPELTARGIRVVQMVDSPVSLLAGSDSPGDQRGLSDLGRATLDRMVHLETPRAESPCRLSLDISRLNTASTRDILSWYEDDPGRSQRLPLSRTRGAIQMPESPAASGLDPDSLKRFRALGGILGLSVGSPYLSSPADLRQQIETVAAIPWGIAPGYEGIGIGTDFLGLHPALSALASPSSVLDWLSREFAPPIAAEIAHRTARRLIHRLTGLPDPE